MLSAIDATISIRCSKSPLANWLTTLVIAQQHMISQWVGKKNSENIPATSKTTTGNIDEIHINSEAKNLVIGRDSYKTT